MFEVHVIARDSNKQRYNIARNSNALCTEELRRRLPIDFKGVTVKVVDKDGVREVDFQDDKQVFAP